MPSTHYDNLRQKIWKTLWSTTIPPCKYFKSKFNHEILKGKTSETLVYLFFFNSDWGIEQFFYASLMKDGYLFWKYFLDLWDLVTFKRFVVVKMTLIFHFPRKEVSSKNKFSWNARYLNVSSSDKFKETFDVC